MRERRRSRWRPPPCYDLLRFEVDTALVRVRRDRPLRRPRCRSSSGSASWRLKRRRTRGTTGAALQLAITVLSQTTGVRRAIAGVIAIGPQGRGRGQPGRVLAGCRDGLKGSTATRGRLARGIPAADVAEATASAAARRTGRGVADQFATDAQYHRDRGLLRSGPVHQRAGTNRRHAAPASSPPRWASTATIAASR